VVLRDFIPGHRLSKLALPYNAGFSETSQGEEAIFGFRCAFSPG
jgi:hypothetical protein